MTTQGGDIEFTFRGNAQQLLAELKKIDRGTTETASKSVASVGKVKSAFDKVDTSSRGVTDGIGKFGSALGRSAGAVDLFSSSSAGAVRALADLADVGEIATATAGGLGVSAGVLGAALVALAAAAAPLGGHLLVVQREASEAAARAAFLTAHAHDLDDALRGLEDATLAAAVATGQLTEAQAHQIAIQDAAARAIQDFATSQEAERQAANESFFAAERWQQRLSVLPGFLQTAADYYGGFTSAQREALHTLEELDRIEDAHEDTIVATMHAQSSATAAEDRKRASREAATVATRRAEEAERALNDAMQAQLALAASNAQVYQQSLADVQAASDKAADAQLSEIGRVLAARERALADLQAKADAGLAVVGNNQSATETLLQEHEAARQEIIRQSDEEITALRRRSAQEYEDWLDRQAEASTVAWRSVAADAAGALGDVAASFASQAEDMATTNKSAARAWFAASKVAALAAAGINVALGLTQALTLPPPADGLKAAFVLLSGGAAIADIASTKPSFHGGGALYPDEALVKMKAGEGVLTPEATQAAGGPAGIAAMNAHPGAMGWGSPTLRIGRMAFREGLRTDVRAGGIVEQEIARRVNRGGVAAGISGKKAIA